MLKYTDKHSKTYKTKSKQKVENLYKSTVQKLTTGTNLLFCGSNLTGLVVFTTFLLDELAIVGSGMKGLSTSRPTTRLNTEGVPTFSEERTVGVLATLELQLELASSLSWETSHNPSSVEALVAKLASRVFMIPILRN